MSANEAVLQKIKLLLKLASSPNENEAENARAMADKLIAKYNITEEELKSIEDKKPLYGEEDKLFVTIGICGWRQQLALAIGKHFLCQIVQEELVPAEGLHQYNYYVYGDPEDSINVMFVYHAFTKRIDEIIATKCIGRGNIYVSSYCEGLVEAIKNNIYWDGIEIPDIKKPKREVVSEEQKVLNNGQSNIVKHKEEKEKPVEKSVDVNSQSLIKDVNAYYKGLMDGANFHLSEILELAAENDTIKNLIQGTEDGNLQQEKPTEDSISES